MKILVPGTYSAFLVPFLRLVKGRTSATWMHSFVFLRKKWKSDSSKLSAPNRDKLNENDSSLIDCLIEPWTFPSSLVLSQSQRPIALEFGASDKDRRPLAMKRSIALKSTFPHSAPSLFKLAKKDCSLLHKAEISLIINGKSLVKSITQTSFPGRLPGNLSVTLP